MLVLLLLVDLLDEAAGVFFAGLPDVGRDLGVGLAVSTVAAFTVPGLVATACEPPLLLLADRLPRWRRAFVAGGLALMGAGLLAAAAAPGPVWFTVALAVAFVGNGLGVNLAQATLVEADPPRREQWLARWVFAGTVGDLCGPLLLAAAAVVGGGWRLALGAVGVAVLGHALVLSRVPFPAEAEEGEEEDEEEAPGLRETWERVRADRRLWAWLVGAGLCGLLDELFLVLASAWLAQAHGASLAARGLLLGLATAGGLLGLVLVDRLLARGLPPLRLLLAASLASFVALAAWVLAPTLAAAGIALFMLELVVAPLYPLAKAQVYRALPGRPALVEAMQGLLSPLDLLAPVLVGLVADRLGLVPAFVLLAAQPLGLALLSARTVCPPDRTP